MLFPFMLAKALFLLEIEGGKSVVKKIQKKAAWYGKKPKGPFGLFFYLCKY